MESNPDTTCQPITATTIIRMFILGKLLDCLVHFEECSVKVTRTKWSCEILLPKLVSTYCFCLPVVDLDAHETSDNSSCGLLQFEEPPPHPSPTPPDPKPLSCHSSPSPPMQRPRYLPCTPTGHCGRGRGQRRGLGRGQMFEDPAVMRMVQGHPSLKVIQAGLLWDGWYLVAKAVLNIDLLNPLQGSWQCHSGLWESHVLEFLWRGCKCSFSWVFLYQLAVCSYCWGSLVL